MLNYKNLKEQIVLLTALIFVLFLPTTIFAGNLPDGFIETKIAAGLDPTHIKLAPDGRIFITEKTGAIKIVKNGSLLPEPFLILEVDNEGERGLQDIVFHPDFSSNNYFYVYYAPVNKKNNRVSRFVASGDKAIPESELILFETHDYTFTYHNGGSMLFGKDGKLYVTVGDHGYQSSAQSLTTFHGKVLRVNDDGSVPEDNPFYNETTGLWRLIYAVGFRNPYQAALDPLTGKIFINDVGGASFEEINELIARKNYGWSAMGYEGTIDHEPFENYQNPILAYSHAEGCAITGGDFYNPAVPEFPSEYINKYFYADYCFGYINILNPIDSSIQTFATGLADPIDMLVADDGSLYYLTRGSQEQTPIATGELWRVQYDGSGKPHISIHPEDQTTPVGGMITFKVIVTGEEPMAYQWQKNGVNITGAEFNEFTINQVAAEDHGATYRVVVSNHAGTDTSESAQVIVSDNNTPVAIIQTPAEGTLYKAGDLLEFSGSGEDVEDGEIPSQSLTWKIDFHHNDHAHPAMDPISGISSGSYQIPTLGETSSNVWYRIYLLVEDSEGLKRTVFRDIYPVLTDVNLETNPAGLDLTLDGQVVTTPYNFTSVAGLVRTIGAVENQMLNSKEYYFLNWQHGGDDIQYITTPESATTYIANFTLVSSIDNYNNYSGNVFPNPVSDVLNIELISPAQEGITIEIIDLSSTVKMNYNETVYAGNNTISLDIRSLPKGFFIINIRSQSVNFNQKFLKN